jgi:hypothetical protein
LSTASAKSTTCPAAERIPPEKLPPQGLLQWIEFCWLSVADPQFRATHLKRKLYFERCMAGGVTLWFHG